MVLTGMLTWVNADLQSNTVKVLRRFLNEILKAVLQG